MKKALKASNQVTSGIKSTLIVHIKLAVKNGMKRVENIDPTIITSMEGAGSQPTSHLEIITPGSNTVVKDKLEDIDRFHVYDPITYGESREYDTNLATMK